MLVTLALLGSEREFSTGKKKRLQRCVHRLNMQEPEASKEESSTGPHIEDKDSPGSKKTFIHMTKTQPLTHRLRQTGKKRHKNCL